MALPTIESPTYKLELPSTGQEVTYRPFLVKEQKNLLIAQNSESQKEIADAIAKIVSDCTFNGVNPYNAPIFDIEYIFIKIRVKSVGETATLNVLCPDDNETYAQITINLDELDVQVSDEHEKQIVINDTVTMHMTYPTVKEFYGLDKLDDVDSMFEMINRCVEKIDYGETTYNKVDITKKEMTDFIESLPSDGFEKIGKFFETMPKVLHVIEVENPKTKKTGEVIIQGLDSFFV
tara:strand:- start:352 stop:1056 length:705 start_codon:yes stop_codon:yes gene_type:complete